MSTGIKLALVDPPWKFANRKNEDTKFGLGMNVYPGMSEYELIDLYAYCLEELMDKDSAIVTWTVNSKLNEYFHILDQMVKVHGYRHVTTLFTWVKISKLGIERKLPGFYTLSNTECCQLMVRGSMDVETKGISQIINTEFNDEEVFYNECLKPHSTKPSEIRKKLVDLFGDVSRIELFSRAEKKIDSEGWINFGNEVKETIGLDIHEALIQYQQGRYV